VLGTSPDAGEAAIRKIVEGLRQSWHPDLASSEPDRQLREQRTTQINVAWEILSGKRPVA
jgi:DnaJ-class molecular chaperone